MTRDPLIFFARFAVIAIRALLGFAALVLLVGLGFTLFASDAQLVETATEMSKMGADAVSRASLGILFGFTLLVVILAERFFQQLQAIIATVPAGEPFSPLNAKRLERMAWLAVAFQTVGLSSTLLSNTVRDVGEQIDLTVELTFEGIFIALLLFILARVFREGAAMREDLEGTV
ncbi:DUF2975 domain-containing protein [Sphingomicrobium flavum]|uniref:DUF2975 domain-containing protein n=1 Tax=Sphingomicrobium flavum TaxID=1229164 RepID=UPI0021ADF2BF|nr:DUF2975 domain-containing protein [Sphingomicrobium flavum]